MTGWLEQLQPVMSYFGDNRYLLAILIIMCGLIAAKLVELFTTIVLKRMTRLTQSDLDDQIIDALQRPLFLTILFMSLAAAIHIIEPNPNIESATLSTIQTLGILVWSTFALTVVKQLLRRISHFERKYTFVRTETLPLFENLAMLTIVGASIYLIFSAWHIDMTAWLASAGIIGIAIGFAAKDTLANLFSGVFILADTPYKIGDYIVLESGERGEITHIGIRSTRMLTRDDVEVTIPNSIMGNTRIINESGGPHKKYRIRVKVGVAYGSDIDQVEKVLMTVANNEHRVCKTPEPRIRFRAFGASSLDLELLCWVDSPPLRGQVLHYLYTAIYKRFIEEGIEIPFTKQDIYIKELPS